MPCKELNDSCDPPACYDNDTARYGELPKVCWARRHAKTIVGTTINFNSICTF